MKLFFLLFFLCINCFALAHEGHQEKKEPPSENIQEKVKETAQEGRPTTWMQWIGSFHLILLHFPIALINMLAISECLFIWYRRPIFEFSSKFLLISAAIIAPPTALLGLIYSYSAFYSGLIETFLLWHMWFGIATAIFTVIVAFMRERIGISKLYYASLAFLVLIINITGFFGGGMTFGPFHMHPPL
jgi:uncharacterized membrane protein